MQRIGKGRNFARHRPLIRQIFTNFYLRIYEIITTTNFQLQIYGFNEFTNLHDYEFLELGLQDFKEFKDCITTTKMLFKPRFHYKTIRKSVKFVNS